MYLFFITSILGALRDYSKTKKLCFYKFIRSPIIIYIFYLIINKLIINNKINKILLAIIFERWFFLILKTIISFKNNDYINKKKKYSIKYNKNN
tara:strand:- start:629 stop:910 length:282 start_codon:yes stop_codon:yes gene_type:complete